MDALLVPPFGYNPINVDLLLQKGDFGVECINLALLFEILFAPTPEPGTYFVNILEG